jgi:DNA-binding transcriptional regulator GbsR (MarR family)
MLDFVEEMGRYFDQNGQPRVVGRITGLLMIAPRPLNAEEIASILQISRSGVSANVQLAQSRNLIQISSYRDIGGRREYYESTVSANMDKIFELYLKRLTDLRDIARSGVKAVADDHPARERLIAAEGFYTYLVNTILSALEKRNELPEQNPTGL